MSSLTAFSGNVPQNYETYLGPLFFEPYALDLIERINNFPQLNQVLEIACGTGRVTKHLAAKLPAGAELLATDLNPDMLKIAQSSVSSNNIQWQVADAHELPFKEGTFDAVICQYGVMFFYDKPKAFREIHRTLKPGGIFLFNTWSELQYNALSRMAQTTLEEIYPEDPPRFLEKGPYSFFDKQLIENLLTQAGFFDVEIEVVPKTGVALSPDDAVNGILDGTPNYTYIAERSQPATVAKEKLKALLVNQYGSQNLQLAMQALVVKATKNH